MITPLTTFKEIRGDDSAYYSTKYGRLNNAFKIDNITPNPDCPLTIAVWTTLQTGFNLHYSEYEINGNTTYDFFMHLKDTYNQNADTIERLLEVYQDDIAKPILGRTELIEYDVRTSGDNQAESIDNPADNPLDDKPTAKQNSTVDNAQTGTTKTTLSDLGVKPNYETLNGFLRENRTLITVFCDFFRNDFTVYHKMEWYQ